MAVEALEALRWTQPQEEPSPPYKRVKLSSSIPSSLLYYVNGDVDYEQVAVSPDGSLCAILLPSSLLITKNKQQLVDIPLQTDHHCGWRRIAWSIDSSLVAVAFSTGNVILVQIKSVHDIQYACDVQSDNPHYSLSDIRISDFVLNPYSVFTFVQLRREADDGCYSLLCCNYNGSVALIDIRAAVDSGQLKTVVYRGALYGIYQIVTAGLWVSYSRQLVLAGIRKHTDSQSYLSVFTIRYDSNETCLLQSTDGETSVLQTRQSVKYLPSVMEAKNLIENAFIGLSGYATRNDLMHLPHVLNCSPIRKMILSLCWNGCFELFRLVDLRLIRSWAPDFLDKLSIPRSVHFWLDETLIVQLSDGRMSIVPETNEIAHLKDPVILDALSSHCSRLSAVATEPGYAYVFVQANGVRYLLCLVSLSPLETMQKAADALPLDDCLTVCKSLGVEQDQVFKYLWTKNSSQPESTELYLSRVKDFDWLYSKCSHPDFADLAVYRTILELVISLTDNVSRADVEGELESVLNGDSELDFGSKKGNAPSAVDLCLARTCCLEFLDKLNTFETIYGANGNFKEYEKFRQTDLLALAVEYAATMKFDALQTLFTRHGHELLAYRLGILELIPECVDPQYYESILPQIDVENEVEQPWQVLGWRKQDWTSSNDVKQLLSMLGDEEVTKPPLKIKSMDYPSPSIEICEWYKCRILQIEQKTGVPMNALRLSNIGVSHNVPSLQPLINSLNILDAILTDKIDISSEMQNSLVSPDLDAISRMQRDYLIELVLSNPCEHNIIDTIRSYVIPVLKEELSDDTSEFDIFLRLSNLIVQMAKEKPECVLAVFKCSEVSRDANNRLIPFPVILSKAVLDICESNIEYESIPMYQSMISSLPQCLGGDTVCADDSEETATSPGNVESMHSNIVHLSKKLLLSRLLGELDIAMPFEDIEDTFNSPSKQLLLIEKMARQIFVIHRDENSQKNGLKPVLDGVIALHDAGFFSSVTLGAIHSSFLSATLSHGLLSTSKSIIHRHGHDIDKHELETIVLNASRELFDNAYDDTDGLLRKANECLRLAAPSVAIQQEIDFLDSVELLVTKYHVRDDETDSTIMPMQIRLHPNRVELIGLLLRQNTFLYSPPEPVMTIAKKLCGESLFSEHVSQVQLRAYLAEAALAEGNTDVAIHYCSQLIRMTFAEYSSKSEMKGTMANKKVSACIQNVFRQIAEAESGVDVHSKMNVMAHNIYICSPTDIVNSVRFWKKFNTNQKLSSCLSISLDNDVNPQTTSRLLFGPITGKSDGDFNEDTTSKLEKIATLWDKSVEYMNDEHTWSSHVFYESYDTYLHQQSPTYSLDSNEPSKLKWTDIFWTLLQTAQYYDLDRFGTDDILFRLGWFMISESVETAFTSLLNIEQVLFYFILKRIILLNV